MPLLKSSVSWRKPFIAALALALTPAALAQGIACPPPEKPMLRAELYFGRDTGGTYGVSERQWADFLARELTPRFPDGLTVLDGQGQWRDDRGATVREPSKVVIIVVPDAGPARSRIQAAVAA
jgi:hypothetical protein